MKMIKKILIAIPMMVSVAFAAPTLPVGTGSETGNYYGMMNDIGSYCGEYLSNGLTLDIQSTGGSSENINGILNKQFAMGIVQADVLSYFQRSRPNEVNQNVIKAIAGLHDEPFHILIPRGWQPEVDKGFFGNLFGGDDPVELNIQSLRDQVIGSTGGGMISARELSNAMDLNLRVVEVNSKELAKQKIPLLLVGGVPYSPVVELLATKNWKLVSLNYHEIAGRAPIYKQTSLTYTMNGKITAVPSIAVQAILVGKSARKESRNRPMIELASCVTASIADLADDYATNPNWGLVYKFMESGGRTSWEMFPLDEQLITQIENESW